MTETYINMRLQEWFNRFCLISLLSLFFSFKNDEKCDEKCEEDGDNRSGFHVSSSEWKCPLARFPQTYPTPQEPHPPPFITPAVSVFGVVCVELCVL